MERKEGDCVFAELEHVDQLREAIRGTSCFDERRVDDYVVFNYKMGHADAFPNPEMAPDAVTREHWLLRRECRGIIFHAETGAVLARRYHKFFNVNELDETMPEEIDLHATGFVVLEKLDGNFVSPFYTQGELVFGAKTGHKNKEARQVQAFVTSQSIDYLGFSKHWVDQGYSPIYEWCSPCEKRVVRYKKPSLILTGIRNHKTGAYVPYEEMQASAEQHGIPVVKAWRGEASSVSDLLAKIGKEEGLEGCVLRFDDGRMYKIKTSWYNTQTVNSDLICQERIIWQLILNNKMDDIKASLHSLPDAELKASGEGHPGKRTIEPLRRKIDRFSGQLFANVEKKSHEVLQRILEAIAHNDSQLQADDESKANRDVIKILLATLEEQAEAFEKPLLRRLVKALVDEVGPDQLLRLAKNASSEEGQDLHRRAAALALETTIDFMTENTEKKHTFDTITRPLGGSIYFY